MARSHPQCWRGDHYEHDCREPVLLGDDGRVWDGHHRIVAAYLAGRLVPVEYGTGGDNADDDNPE